MREFLRSVGRLITDGSATFGVFLGSLLLLAVAAFFFGYLPVQIARNWARWAVLLLYPLLVISLGVLLFFLLSERRRKRSLHWIMKEGALGWLSPVAVAGFAFLFAASIFTVGTALLDEVGAVSLRLAECRTNCRPDLEHVWNFYTWHFLDAVPFLDINESLRWEVPVTYASALAGWMVITFKALVIVPLIQSIRTYWQVRAEVPRIRFRTWAWPRVVRAGEGVTINWAPAPPPDGWVFRVRANCPAPPPTVDVWIVDEEDVAVRGITRPSRGPAEATYSDPAAERTLLAGTRDTSGEFKLKGPGTYRFRAECWPAALAAFEAFFEVYGHRASIQSRDVRVEVLGPNG